MSYLQQKSVGTDFLMLGFLFSLINFLNFQTHAITAFININQQYFWGLSAFSCLLKIVSFVSVSLTDFWEGHLEILGLKWTFSLISLIM